MADLPAVQQALPPATIEDHPVAVYLARLTSPQSRRTMRSKLDVVARLILRKESADAWQVPWALLQPIHLDAVRSILAERNAPATANCMMAAVRGVLTACWRIGQIDGERLSRLTDVEPVRGNTPPAGRSLEPAEITALFASCQEGGKPNRAARDSAILALLYGGGLRRAEAAALDFADVELGREELTVRRGKGNKGRIVPLVLGAADYLHLWIAVRGESEGALLHPINKGDSIQPCRMTPDAIGLVVKRLCESARLRPAVAHDFRRTLIGDLLDAGADLVSVQQIAGHASPTTSARYDRRPSEARRKAARLVRLPLTPPPPPVG
jgi:integrase